MAPGRCAGPTKTLHNTRLSVAHLNLKASRIRDPARSATSRSWTERTRNRGVFPVPLRIFQADNGKVARPVEHGTGTRAGMQAAPHPTKQPPGDHRVAPSALERGNNAPQRQGDGDAPHLITQQLGQYPATTHRQFEDPQWAALDKGFSASTRAPPPSNTASPGCLLRPPAAEALWSALSGPCHVFRFLRPARPPRALRFRVRVIQIVLAALLALKCRFGSSLPGRPGDPSGEETERAARGITLLTPCQATGQKPTD